MTVKELKEILEHVNEDAEVFVISYGEATSLDCIEVSPGEITETGDFNSIYNAEKYPDKCGYAKAVILR